MRRFWNEQVEDADGDVFAIGIGFVRIVVSRRASDDDLLGYVVYFGALFALVYEAGDQHVAGETILGVIFLEIKFAVLVGSAHAIA